jgi:hypothetical protein
MQPVRGHQLEASTMQLLKLALLYAAVGSCMSVLLSADDSSFSDLVLDFQLTFIKP